MEIVGELPKTQLSDMGQGYCSDTNNAERRRQGYRRPFGFVSAIANADWRKD